MILIKKKLMLMKKIIIIMNYFYKMTQIPEVIHNGFFSAYQKVK